MPSTLNHDEKTRINEALLAKYDRSNSSGKVWRFSDTGYEGCEGYCRLKRVLHFHQVPETVDSNTKFVFIRGHLTELVMEPVVRLIHPGLIVHPFDHAPLQYTHPQHGWTVQGRPDGLVWPNTVIEFKSVNADSVLTKPHESHECQVMITMMVIDRFLGEYSSQHPATGTIYYDKAGREFCVEPFTVTTDNRINKIIDELTLVNNAYNRSDYDQLNVAIDEHGNSRKPTSAELSVIIQNPAIMPARMSTADRFPCHWITRKGEGFCGYYELCWGARPAPVRYAGPRKASKPRAPRKRRTDQTSLPAVNL